MARLRWNPFSSLPRTWEEGRAVVREVRVGANCSEGGGGCEGGGTYTVWAGQGGSRRKQHRKETGIHVKTEHSNDNLTTTTQHDRTFGAAGWQAVWGRAG